MLIRSRPLAAAVEPAIAAEPIVPPVLPVTVAAPAPVVTAEYTPFELPPLTGNDVVTGGLHTLDLSNFTVPGSPLDEYENPVALILDQTIVGTRGDDAALVGALGNDTIIGGGGNDVIRGGSGNDTIYGDSGPRPFYKHSGVDGNDTIDAGRGHDTVYAGGGRDFVNGGLGNDTIWGQAGDDVLDAGAGGYDKLDGGAGSDWLIGGGGQELGNTKMTGGDGSDVFVYRNCGLMIEDFGKGGIDSIVFDETYHTFSDFQVHSANSGDFVGCYITATVDGQSTVLAGLIGIDAADVHYAHLDAPHEENGVIFSDGFFGAI